MKKGDALKRILAVIILSIVVLFAGISHAEITGSISDSQVAILDSDSMKISGITIDGLPGTYWAEFHWDSSLLAFMLGNYSEETLATGKTWTVGIQSYSGDQISITIATDPGNNLINISATGIEGGFAFFYFFMDFIQGSNQFDLSTYSFDNDTALFTGNGGWNGSGTIYAGVTKSGVISEIPSWFDFSQPFTFAYGNLTWILD